MLLGPARSRRIVGSNSPGTGDDGLNFALGRRPTSHRHLVPHQQATFGGLADIGEGFLQGGALGMAPGQCGDLDRVAAAGLGVDEDGERDGRGGGDGPARGRILSHRSYGGGRAERGPRGWAGLTSFS